VWTPTCPNCGQAVHTQIGCEPAGVKVFVSLQARNCPRCGTALTLKARQTGKQSAEVRLLPLASRAPDLEELWTFSCPGCGQPTKVIASPQGSGICYKLTVLSTKCRCGRDLYLPTDSHCEDPLVWEITLTARFNTFLDDIMRDAG
jgi:hypothetical protein